MRGGGKAHDLLKVSENATEQEIRKAYMDLALQHHPDRGGDTETFQSIQNAYERIKFEGDEEQLRNNPMRNDPLYYPDQSTQYYTYYPPQFDSTQYYTFVPYQYTYQQPQREIPIKPVYRETTMFPSVENINLILARTLNSRRKLNNTKGNSAMMDQIVNEVKALVDQMEVATSNEMKSQLMRDANLWEYRAQELLYNFLK